jgi:16S rRNA (uracil1498-N3)-methyltransferase
VREDRIYRKQADQPRITEAPLIHKLKNVLRKRKGDEVIVFDGKGRQFSAIIDTMARSSIGLTSFRLVRSVKRQPYRLTLAFSLLKGLKVDLLLQKATELGIDCFIPVICRHTVVGLPGKTKSGHWEKILIEATTQSGRLFLPDLRSPERLEDLVRRLKEYSLVLVAELSAGQTVSQVLRKSCPDKRKDLLLLVGPEGGFAETERTALEAEKNVSFVRISKYVLRAETAAIFLAGLVAYEI